MAQGDIKRIAAAVLVGYFVNAILAAATDELLSYVFSGARSPRPYFIADLATQCLYIILGGYLCCLIARPSQPVAMAALIGLGGVVGAASLLNSWTTEPHWYGIALLVTFPPCVWIGWIVRARIARHNSST